LFFCLFAGGFLCLSLHWQHKDRQKTVLCNTKYLFFISSTNRQLPVIH